MSSSEWKIYKLGELVEPERGISYGIVQPGEFLKEGGVPVLKVNNLTERKVEEKDLFRVTEEVERKFGRTRLQGNELLVSVVGSLGHVHKVSPSEIGWNVVRAIAVLPIKEGINRDWVYWCMKSPIVQTAFHNLATVTVQATLNIKELKEIEIPIPDDVTQKKIASILSSLDDKIELNRQTNATLEAIAQALFKEWFVDFNYPGATGEMVESELGMIPKEWKVGRLRDIVELNPKLSLKKGAVAKYVEMKDLSENSAVIKRRIEREFSGGSKFQNGDTLLARITPCLENGKTGFVGLLDGDEVGWGSTEFIVMRGKPRISSYYVYCLSRHSTFRDFAIQSMVGSSGRQRVVESILSDFQIVAPSSDSLARFHFVAEPLFESLLQNEKENHILIQLRDILLPRLMSGKTSVSNQDMNVLQSA
jgi:type I restriction enzyme S subunit